MASLDQIRALLTSRLDNDDQRFWAAAASIAAHEVKKGVGRSRELELLVERGRARAASPQFMNLAQMSTSHVSPLSAEHPQEDFADIVLSDATSREIDRVFDEQREVEKLRARGFEPSRKILLLGPPGTGKTMTARALAKALDVPLFQVQLDGLIGSHLGETAKQLRQIFNSTAANPGMYFFDEFDAIASKRERNSNGASSEMNRVTNSLLTMMDQDRSSSIFIAASNFEVNLDAAVFRRFDTVVRFHNPTAEQRKILITKVLAKMDASKLQWPAIVDACDGLSHSEIETACVATAKTAILNTDGRMSQEELLQAFEHRRREEDEDEP